MGKLVFTLVSLIPLAVMAYIAFKLAVFGFVFGGFLGCLVGGIVGLLIGPMIAAVMYQIFAAIAYILSDIFE